VNGLPSTSSAWPDARAQRAPLVSMKNSFGVVIPMGMIHLCRIAHLIGCLGSAEAYVLVRFMESVGS
jgi:hypothetical protein